MCSIFARVEQIMNKKKHLTHARHTIFFRTLARRIAALHMLMNGRNIGNISATFGNPRRSLDYPCEEFFSEPTVIKGTSMS
jgi:hypothetical protein